MKKKSYFDMQSETYIENWSPGLRQLSIASVAVPLSKKYLDVLFCKSTVPEYIHEFYDMVQDILSHFPNGNMFVRLGSRSPKDVHRVFLKVESYQNLMDLFNNSSRVKEDLDLAVKYNYQPYLWCREWIDIPEWSEFRCFIKNRKLIGVSQYHYHKKFDEILECKLSIQWVIENMFSKKLIKESHLDSFVADVFLKRFVDDDLHISWECKLLEINPYSIWTDPCKFTWNYLADGLNIMESITGKDSEETFRVVGV